MLYTQRRLCIWARLGWSFSRDLGCTGKMRVREVKKSSVPDRRTTPAPAKIGYQPSSFEFHRYFKSILDAYKNHVDCAAHVGLGSNCWLIVLSTLQGLSSSDPKSGLLESRSLISFSPADGYDMYQAPLPKDRSLFFSFTTHS
jgi:hypothetical protein